MLVSACVLVFVLGFLLFLIDGLVRAEALRSPCGGTEGKAIEGSAAGSFRLRRDISGRAHFRDPFPTQPDSSGPIRSDHRSHFGTPAIGEGSGQPKPALYHTVRGLPCYLGVGPRNHQRNVILRLATAELLHRRNDGLEKGPNRKVRMAFQRVE